MQSARCLPIIMKYPLILCSVLASLSTSIARKHGPHSGSPDLRIVGGYEASLRSHPYIVSLQIDLLFFQQHFCGGSILNERWILTAAHCVNGSWLKNWRSIVAVVGTNDNKNKDSTAQTLRISERIPHPNYNGETHDIAMLKTAKNIQYNDAVYPINFPLPMRGTQKFQNLILVGWGLLESPKPPYYVPALPDKLQEVQVEYIPMDECKKAIDVALEAIEDPARVEEISNYDLDTRGQICTGPITGGVSACNGDSGGPLIQYISIKDFTTDTTQITTEDIEYENTASDDSDSLNKELTDDTRRRKTKKIFAGFADKVQKYKDDGLIPVLIGLVSWSIKPCGKVGAPNINTNVSTYADFIHKHLND